MPAQGAGGPFLRRYESLFILNPELTQEETKEVVDKFQQIVTRNNGKMIMTNPMGIRKLSFDIQRQSRGFYVLLDYAAEPEIIKELERNFRIDERVLNYQTCKLKNKITEEEIQVLVAQKPAPGFEKEKSEEKPFEPDATSDVVADAAIKEEEPQKEAEKIDVPYPEEPIDEAQPNNTEDET